MGLKFPPNDEAIRLLVALGYSRGYNDALHAYFTDRGLYGTLSDQFAHATADMWPPSLGSATVYWDSVNSSSYVTLSNGYLTTTIGSGSSTGGTTRATVGKSGSKWYWEVEVGAIDSGSNVFDIGIAISTFDAAGGSFVGTTSDSWSYRSDGTKMTNAFSGDAYGASYTTGDVVGVAFDASAGSLTFYKNNASQGVAFTGIAAGTYYPAMSCLQGGTVQATATAAFDLTSLAYTPPSEYRALDEAQPVWADGVWGNFVWANSVWYGMTGTVGVPLAPTIGTAIAGDTNTTVPFTPRSPQGSTITGYTATSTPGSITATNTTTPVIVTGLTNGVAYTFTVHATNAEGNSSESSASNSVTPSIGGSASGAVITNIAATISGSNLVVTGTSDRSITSGLWGFAYSIGEGEPLLMAFSETGSSAGAQSITIALADMGAVAGDTINVDPFYDANPAGGSEVYCSTSDDYVTPIVYTPAIAGTTTSGSTLTGSFSYVVGPAAQIVTQLWQQCDTGGANCSAEGGMDTTLVLDAGNVGSTIKYTVTSTLDALTGTATSSATATIT